jgi:hypothetical protein
VLIKAYIPLGEAHALFVATHLSDRKRPIQVHTCNANDTHVSMSDIRVGHKKTPKARARKPVTGQAQKTRLPPAGQNQSSNLIIPQSPRFGGP